MTAAVTLNSTIFNARRASTPPMKTMVVECSSRQQKKATAHHCLPSLPTGPFLGVER
ncbi:hypothetical protein QJS10_CPB12g01237 [Acorus calamus]|uniref:Uncharacterized protein n=1 Tax=Acorus calamus TaxID=4465 RepID=A0AAV9DQ93_ACOCL|nr:hypothetical protein QJS10_CPB12g01237 [Acorus calamus]